MIAYAEHVFRLSMTDASGVSEREHLEQVEKATGKRPAALDGPPLPEIADPVWTTFASLHARRNSGMEGPQPLSYEAILAWCNLYGIRLSLWEMEVIEALDALWLRIVQEHKNG